MHLIHSDGTANTIPFFHFLMKSTRFVALSLSLLLAGVPRFARAAEGPTQEKLDLAAKVLELAYTPTTLRDSFSGFLNPALDAMKAQGMPEAARTEMRKAFTEWFDEQIRWTEMKPKLIRIYAQDFSEEELKALLSIYQQPLGMKVMTKLPAVMQDGAQAGQEYFMSKRESLDQKIAPIFEKYKTAK